MIETSGANPVDKFAHRKAVNSINAVPGHIYGVHTPRVPKPGGPGFGHPVHSQKLTLKPDGINHR